MPTMNPDGFEIATEGDSRGTYGRRNHDHIDLNRNFPDQFETTEMNKYQEPETVAVMKWVKSIPFVLSANLHGGSLVANYPWDNSKSGHSTYSKCPDDDIFIRLCKAYSFAHSTMHIGHPCPTLSGEYFKDGITNGAHWYSVSGGMQDWNYVHTNCFEITIELGCYKYPRAVDLPGYWGANKFALLVYMGQVHKGIRGFVVDSTTGLGIANADISVKGINHVIKSAINGDYWRLLVPGSHHITVSHPRYESQTIVVRVTDGPAVYVNFTLSYAKQHSWSAHSDFDIQENMENANYQTIHDADEERKKIANLNPSFVTYEPLLVTRKGLALSMLHMSKSIGKHSSHKAHVLLVGGVNGDDPVGSEMLMRFSRHITTGYNHQHPDCVKIIENVHLHILPTLNIEGISKATLGDCTGDTYKGNKFSSLIENKDQVVEALINQINAHKFHLILKVQGGGLNILIPRNQRENGSQTVITEDNEIFQVLARSFGDFNPKMYDQSSCEGGGVHGIVHAADSPLPNHILMDMMYDKYHSYMLCASISCCKYPAANELPNIWMNTMPSFMSFLLKATQGIHGEIVDTDNKPISTAVLTIDNKIHRFNVSNNGSYFIVLTEGHHTIEASAEGYKSLSKKIFVLKNERREVKFMLKDEKERLSYHSFNALKLNLTEISKQYSNITQLTKIGLSKEGRDILIFTVGKKVNSKPVPHVLLLGNVYGTDLISRELLLQLIQHLVESYLTDDTVTELIESTVIHIIPTLNPDKGEKMKLDNCSGETYPALFTFPDGSDSFTTEHSEVKAFTNWMNDRQITASFILHGGDQQVQYPKLNTENEDKEVFKLASVYTNHHTVLHGIKYLKAVTVPQGTLQNYLYNVLKVPSISIYTSICKVPPATDLLSIWLQNKKPLISVLQEVHRGIGGQLQDSKTKHIPSKSTIQIQGTSAFQIHIDSTGQFFIYLSPGDYHITTNITDYKPFNLNVKVEDGFEARGKYIILDVVKARNSTSPFLVTLAMGCLVFLVVIVVTIFMCKKYQRKPVYQKLGFRKNLDEDDDDNDDEVYMEYGMKSKLIKNGTKPYHDDSSEEEQDLYNTDFRRQHYRS